MRTYDIAYVKQGTVVGYPVKPLEDMMLSEIKQRYLKICAKSNGSVSACKECASPCKYGERAIELSTADVPLYNGMTLIERAKLDNLKRREEKKEETMEKKSKDNRKFIKDWYKQAMATDDPVNWVMNTYNIDRKKAMAKLYQWRVRHIEEQKTDIVAEKKSTTSFDANNLESKLDILMKAQEQQKKLMVSLQEQYNLAKENYDVITKKIDILCTAMDIVNE